MNGLAGLVGRTLLGLAIASSAAAQGVDPARSAPSPWPRPWRSAAS